MNITIADGKYTVVCDEVKGFRALRYGKEWRDLTGDNLVAELALEIEELRAALQSQDREDAENYRWIKEHGLVSFPKVRDWMTVRIVHPMPKHVNSLDAAIDHARHVEGEG